MYNLLTNKFNKKMAEQLKKAIEAIANSKEEFELLSPEEGEQLDGGLEADNKCKNGFTVNCQQAFSIT
jgi:hypothetical protein